MRTFSLLISRGRRLTFLLFFFFISLSAQIRNNFPAEPTSYQLENGLQVILAEDYSLPIVSVAVAYRVGSMNEENGKTGLARLMETLMFQGSRNVERMQHIRLIQRVGGRFNALTNHNKTLFFQTVSSNHLPLVLWLESDRMNALNISRGNVESAKIMLIQGLRNRARSDPYWEASILFNRLAYSGEAAQHSLFGNENDLRSLTVRDVQKFYSLYYRPNNAVLCISGSFDLPKTRELIKKYFGSIPKGNPLPAVEIPEFPAAGSESETVISPAASTPALFLGYHLSVPYTRDYYALKLIEYILFQGNSGRLQVRLIQRERLAHRFSGGIQIRGSQSIFQFFITSTNEYTRERSQRAVFSELNKLKSNPLSDEEIAKVKSLFKRDYINHFSTAEGRSLYLIDYLLIYNNFDGLQEELDKYLQVTPLRILGVTNRYFNDNHLTVHVNLK